MIKVVKFGGSSLANAEQFQKVVDIIQSDPDRRFVIPSAPGKRFSGDEKVTDMLYDTYRLYEEGGDFTARLKDIKARYEEIRQAFDAPVDLDSEFAVIEEKIKAGAGRDYVASRGEYLNGKLLAAILGFEFVDPAEIIVFSTDGQFNMAATDQVLPPRVKQLKNAVIPGFYGADKTGRVVTFSRGGSDVTGSIIAREVNADLYENWTDVSGFLVTDPHVVENPERISIITYREMRELSYMGASVLHEDAIFPLRSEGIPVNIRNTNCPDDPGTMIVETTCSKPKYTITGIGGKKGFVSVTVEKDMMNSEIGFGRRLLQVFEEAGLSFEHTPSGIDTFCVYVNQEDFQKVEQKVISGIHKAVNPDLVELESDLALIAVVGRGMKDNFGTAGRIFAALSHARVNVKMIDQGSSELNIIIGVKNKDFETAIKAIYDIFVLTQL
ncbi:MAG: aspartate kinase [Eubacterium sp.]|nr:aspartate kinase [Eubacterium sp.]